MLMTPPKEAERVQLKDEELMEKARAEGSLLSFIEAHWRYVEPSAFSSNWHIDAICDHLEAVAHGEITRLLINVPPRHMKSLGANVFFPGWVWAQDPDPVDPITKQRSGHGMSVNPAKWLGAGVKFMCLSYDARWSTRDSVKCRRVIQSPLYQRYWGDRVKLVWGQDTKTRFDNEEGGFRFSTSETGAVTGEGADIILFDDPHNVRHADSDPVREGTLQFWDESMPSRLNDAMRGAFVVIMQRVHERDLSGHIIAKEKGWTHLCLPALYESDHPHVFSMGGTPHRHPAKKAYPHKWKIGDPWKDPRTEGEPLWEAKFPRVALENIAKDAEMSSHVAAGQLQQRPTSRQGGVFKREWFEIVQALPATANFQRVRAWDFAATAEDKNDPDYTVGLLMSRDALTGVFYIQNIIRERLSPANVERTVLMTARMDNSRIATRIRIPRDPGQAGIFQVRHYANLLAGFQIIIEAEENTKEIRAESFAAQCEVGNVKLVKGDWNEAFINEMGGFPKAAHDDQVDAATAAFRALVNQQNLPLQSRYSAR